MRDAIGGTAASYAISDQQGAKEKRSGQLTMNRSKHGRYVYENRRPVTR